MSESELLEVLRQAVTSACLVAEETATPMPTRARRVMWLELEPTGQTEPTIRQARDCWLSGLPKEIWHRIFTNGSVLAFLNAAETMRPAKNRLNALQVYFDTLGRFAWEPEFGRQFCQWLVEFGNPPATLPMSASLLVQSFSAHEPFALGDHIELWPVRDADIDTYGEDHAFLKQRPLIKRTDWICRIASHEQVNPKPSFAQYRGLMDDLLNALALVSDGGATFQLFSCRPNNVLLDEPVLARDSSHRSTHSSTPVRLEPCDITRLQSTFAAVRRVRSEPRLGQLALPLRRLRSAVARSSDEDQFVDYVIALERLLTADANTEISFRFRIRGAALLPESFGDIPERIRFMQELYSLRSAAVHGSARSPDLSALLPKAEKAVKVVTQWYLEQLDKYQSINNTLQRLDLALVAGGDRWIKQ